MPFPKLRLPSTSKRTRLLLNTESSMKKNKLNKSNESSEPTDHYLLKDVEGNENENDIDVVLNKDILKDGTTLLAECREEFQIIEPTLEEGEDPAEDVDTTEIIEHVCGKCFKTFRTVKYLKRHMEYCNFSSNMTVRMAEMERNIDKIEKEALIMEKKDICFCCGDSYDTYHLGHINCPECPKTFKTQFSLERHMFLIHSDKNDFPCDVCNGRIRTAALLKLHKEQHTSRGKPFACKKCGKDFTRQYHLKRHMKFSSCGEEQKEVTPCKVCRKEFFRVDNLRMHLKTHLGQGTRKKEEYMCPFCKKMFYSLSTLNIHIRTHTGERPFDCDLCEKNFPSLVSLKKHRRYHTGEKPYSCSVCNQNFAVKEVLNRHMKLHTGHKPHACEECGKRFIQATQLRTHARTHLRPYECQQCPEKYKTEKQLQNHNKQHLKPSRQKKNKYDCLDCGSKFTSKAGLLKHEESKKHLANANEQCPECGEVCSKGTLRFHMLKNHEDTMETLRFHMLKNPEDTENSFKCMQCDSTFKNESELNAHVISAHNEIEFDEENVKKEGEGIVIQEYIIESHPTEIDVAIDSVNNFTIIARDDVVVPDFDGIKQVGENSASAIITEIKKEAGVEIPESQSDICETDKGIQENVVRLLDLLVDAEILRRFGWPMASAESVLRKVIENCGYSLSNKKFTEDYGTRMREFVKLLFTVVLQNDSIKELLNNYAIDEVIETVLSDDKEDDD